MPEKASRTVVPTPENDLVTEILEGLQKYKKRAYRKETVANIEKILYQAILDIRKEGYPLNQHEGWGRVRPQQP